MVDAPQNPTLALMYAQSLFAVGKYDEAAGVVQAAISQLPKTQWGIVVTNSRELYGNYQDYTNQLRALEAAARDKPNEPALRFLLGYHYAYLGYPQQAVDQLEKVMSLAPQDDFAKQLRDEMKAKLPARNGSEVVPAPSSLVPSRNANYTAMMATQFSMGR